MEFRINSHQKIKKIINKRNLNKLRRRRWLKREEEEDGKRNSNNSQSNKGNNYNVDKNFNRMTYKNIN